MGLRVDMASTRPFLVSIGQLDGIGAVKKLSLAFVTVNHLVHGQLAFVPYEDFTGWVFDGFHGSPVQRVKAFVMTAVLFTLRHGCAIVTG